MEDDGAWWVDHSAEEGEVAEEGRLPRALTVRAFAGSLRLQKGPDFLESVNKNRTLKIKGRFQLPRQHLRARLRVSVLQA
jgi:hypothetical protein